jgi:uncharacterized protein YbjQ (UPF0145 family)/DNA-directed RNA polymerase subunit RPC12/RpoP
MEEKVFVCPICRSGQIVIEQKRKYRCDHCGIMLELREDRGGYTLLSQKPKIKEYKSRFDELVTRYGGFTHPTFLSIEEWDRIAAGGVSDDEQKVKDAEEEEKRVEQQRDHILSTMILTTSSNIDNKQILEYKGIVGAQVMAGISVFKDVFAGIRNIVGGRSEALQESMRRMRKEVLDELKEEAYSVGANAVIAVRLDFDEYAENMMMLTASGTAVRI